MDNDIVQGEEERHADNEEGEAGRPREAKRRADTERYCSSCRQKSITCVSRRLMVRGEFTVGMFVFVNRRSHDTRRGGGRGGGESRGGSQSAAT